MDHILSSLARPARAHPGLLRRLFGVLSERRSRRRLGELDDHLLRDIGLTRGEARLEAERMGWDAPGHWLR